MRNHGFSERALVADLRVWWSNEVGTGADDPFADPGRATCTISDVIPVIDSLGVLTALLTIEKHVRFEVPPQIIRHGGYGSFDEMVSDLLPKVRSLAEKYMRVSAKKAA